MKWIMSVTAILLFASAAALADEQFESACDGLVDDAGDISLPSGFRAKRALLGTWSILGR